MKFRTRLWSFLLHEFVIPRERSPDDEFKIVGARCEEGAGLVPLNAIHTTLIIIQNVRFNWDYR